MANALELPQSCTKPSIYNHDKKKQIITDHAHNIWWGTLKQNTYAYFKEHNMFTNIPTYQYNHVIIKGLCYVLCFDVNISTDRAN